MSFSSASRLSRNGVPPEEVVVRPSRYSPAPAPGSAARVNSLATALWRGGRDPWGYRVLGNRSLPHRRRPAPVPSPPERAVRPSSLRPLDPHLPGAEMTDPGSQPGTPDGSWAPASGSSAATGDAG